MHARGFFVETMEIADQLDYGEVERMAEALSKITGRIYCIGLGGSLANCMHMAADFRKLCNLDAVAPDNLAELTAWANDEGLPAIFHGYLAHMKPEGALFVLSVGGGTDTVSAAIAIVVRAAKEIGVPIFGIVGPDGGETARLGDYVIRIPAPKDRVTPHTEAFQAVIWHALICHPLLQKRKMTW